MPLVVGASRLILVLAFGLAAWGKLRSPSSFRLALEGFGVPARLSRLLQWIVPAVEVGIALALLASSSMRAAAASALALLVVFTMVVLRNLMVGRHPKCNCFGDRHSQPISWRTVARNALLATCALVLITAGSSPASVIPAGIAQWWPQHTGAIVAVLSGLLALQLWIILLLVAQRGQILIRLERLESTGTTTTPLAAHGAEHGGSGSMGLPVGSIAPDFALAGSNGELVSLASLRAARKPVVLVFVDPSCGPCKALVPDIAARYQSASVPATIAVISQGPRPSNGAAGSVPVKNLLWQQDREIADAYRVAGTPMGVLISPDGLIASTPAAGAVHVRALLDRANDQGARPRDGHHHAPGSTNVPLTPPVRRELGNRIPKLADVLGREALDSLSGSRIQARNGATGTMLLFWNPSCGFCTQLLPDLQRLARQDKIGSVRIVVVSQGSFEENAPVRELFETILDPDMQIMRRAQVSGTPIAIMFDDGGDQLSDAAAGGPAVLELLGSHALNSLTAGNG